MIILIIIIIINIINIFNIFAFFAFFWYFCIFSIFAIFDIFAFLIIISNMYTYAFCSKSSKNVKNRQNLIIFDPYNLWLKNDQNRPQNRLFWKFSKNRPWPPLKMSPATLPVWTPEAGFIGRVRRFWPCFRDFLTMAKVSHFLSKKWKKC